MQSFTLVAGSSIHTNGGSLLFWYLLYAVNLLRGRFIAYPGGMRLKKGQVVLVLEERQEDGHERVRIGDDRWISRVTDKGKVLAQPAPGREDDAIEPFNYDASFA